MGDVFDVYSVESSVKKESPRRPSRRGTRPSRRRVVVTGMGVMSPLGSTLGAFWSALLEGHSGIRALDLAGPDGKPLAGGRVPEALTSVEDFCPLSDAVGRRLRKAMKTMNRQTRLGVAAAERALADSRIPLAELDPYRVGVSFGVGHVGIRPEDFRRGVEACRTVAGGVDLAAWGADGLPLVNPLWMLTCMPNLPASYVAILHELQGPNNTVTLDAAAANIALASGVAAIAEGEADVMIVGGCDNYLDPCSLLHVAGEVDLARPAADPEDLLCPFDARRSGTVPAEGAAALVLETAESAAVRGARVYGEVLATATSCVVRRDGTPDRTRAMANAMRGALTAAGGRPSWLGHVHAHGLSSPSVDHEEARAIREVLGDWADRVPVTAAKSCFGHAGAGSSGLEIVASLLALSEAALFPVHNCEQPDAACPISPATEPRPLEGDGFIKLSVTPRGHASAVVARKAA